MRTRPTLIAPFSSVGEMYRMVGDPRNKVAMALGLAFVKDFPNASSVFRELLAASAIGPNPGANFALWGRRPRI